MSMNVSTTTAAYASYQNNYKTGTANKKKKRLGREELTLNLMILPGMIILIIFVFAPLVGSLMAFENYVPAKGLLKSKWVGLSNFQFIFSLPDSKQVFMNTLIIAFSKLVVNIFVPVTFAILLNEIRVNVCKKIFQTVVYLPHFLSWVVLATVVTNMFSLDGPINAVISAFGGNPIYFLADNKWFRTVIVGTDVWKEFGYNSVVYLAALTGIDPGLFEAASIDGSGNIRTFVKIALPLAKPIIAVMVIFTMVAYWNDWFTALIYMQEKSRYPLQLVLRQILIQSQAMASMMGNMDGGYAEANKLTELIKFASIVVGSVPMLIAYPFVQKYFEKGFMAGAVKG